MSGLIFNIAACTRSISEGTTTSSVAFTAHASRHVPRLCGRMTCAPTETPRVSRPVSTTTPAPSKPGVAGRGNRIGYFPSIWFKSAGLIGAARIATITSSGAQIGHGSLRTCKTSAGFPCAS